MIKYPTTHYKCVVDSTTVPTVVYRNTLLEAKKWLDGYRANLLFLANTSISIYRIRKNIKGNIISQKRICHIGNNPFEMHDIGGEG